MIGKRGGRVRFNLRSMRPNSLLTVYSTAGPKQRRSDPAMMQFEEGGDDGDSEVEETAEPVEVRSYVRVYELIYDLSGSALACPWNNMLTRVFADMNVHFFLCSPR